MNEPLPAFHPAEYPEPPQRSRSAAEQGSRGKSSPLPLHAPNPLPNTRESTLSPTLNWQDTLWREWRNTPDEEYARHLFELVADAPAGRVAAVGNLLLGAFYGSLVGLLAAVFLWLTAPTQTTQLWLPLVGISAAIGGAIDLLFFKITRANLSWRRWLSRLSVNLLTVGLTGLIFAALAAYLALSPKPATLDQNVGVMGLGIILIVILGTRQVGWLTGFGLSPKHRDVHLYRNLWLWWRKRPGRREVTTALWRACNELLPKTPEPWPNLTKTLASLPANKGQFERLIDQLHSRNWQERFIAGQLLTTSGGEAIAALEPVANRITSPLRKTAIHLLKATALETETQLARRAGRLLCPHCLAFFGPHQIIVDEAGLTYYGCRLCGQSRQFWEGQVIAVLDETMGDSPQPQTGGVRVNWLARRQLFDFHAIEIIRASDEDVERFAVQVGNDTDPARQARYRQMTCYLDPACRLSANSQRVLARILGKVVQL